MNRKNRRLNLNRTINDRNGFTLAELLLVVGIIVILTGISFIAATYYSRILKLNEMDNTAKQIFIAAQNHLTSVEATGELDRYAQSAGESSNDETGLGVLMNYEPSDAKDTNIGEWPAAGENTEFYYIRHDKNCDIDDSVLAYALPKGAVDDYVNTEGKYIIEYDVKTASVYAVFYTEDKNTLDAATVQELNGNPSGRGGDSDAKDVRKNHQGPTGSEIVGYYGGAMAVEWRAQNTQLSLNVQNGNKQLVEDWDNNGQTYEKERLTAIVRVPDDLDAEKIVLKVHGVTSDNDVLVTYDVGGTAAASGSNIVYDVDCGKSGVNTKTFGTVTDLNKALNDECREYQIVLDDLVDESYLNLQNVGNCHFAYLFPTLLPGEDIELTAYTYSQGSRIGISDILSTNSIFESAVNSTSTYEGEKAATISSFRHLENMDTGISGIQRKSSNYSYHGRYKINGESLDFASASGSSADYNDTVKFIYTEYDQTADLDWDAYYNKTGSVKTLIGVDKSSPVGTVSSVVLYDANSTNGNPVGAGTFYSIIKNDMLEYNGNDHVIENVNILNNNGGIDDDASGLGNGALFGYLNYLTEKNNVNSMSSRDCTIHDLVLTGFEVRTRKNAAALVGEAKAEGFGSLYIRNILVEKGSMISGNYKSINDNDPGDGSNRGNAAALVAYTTNPLNVDGCGSSATVASTGSGYSAGSSAEHVYAADTGGLAGEIADGGTFTDSYTGGTTNSDGDYTTNNVKGTYSAGGILGRSSRSGNVVMNNCYSTCSVYSNLTNSGSYNAYAGGLIGYNGKGSSKFTKCYATGAIRGGSDTIRGTMIGKGSSSFSSCYYLYYPNSKYNSNIYAAGDSTSNPTGVKMTRYTAMEAKASSQNNLTQRNNISESDYPFVTVNKTYNKKKITSFHYSGAHYGDWPVVADDEKDLLFAYREKVITGYDADDQPVTGVFWYIVGIDEDGSYYIVKDTLPKNLNARLDDSNPALCEWSYGYIQPGSKGNSGLKSYFQGNAYSSANSSKIVFKNGQTYTSTETLNIGSNDCTFWKFSTNGTGSIITTPQQNGPSGEETQFMFNREYAGCISTHTLNDLGTASNMYQIRSEKQLENVNDSLSSQFHQTLDIDLALDNEYDFTAIGKKSTASANGFSGVYSGSIDDEDLPDTGETCYTIQNFAQTVTDTEDTGLFGMIVKAGSVHDLDLEGRSAELGGNTTDITVQGLKAAAGSDQVDGNNANSVDIGGFAAYNSGTVQNCSADLVIKSNAGTSLPDMLICAGGMFGSNVDKTSSNTVTVSGCQFRGKLILDDLNCSKTGSRIRAGGFAGRNSKTITDCMVGIKKSGNDPAAGDEKAVIDIRVNTTADMASNRNDKIGGFAGEQRVNMSNCICNADLNYDAGNTKQRYALVGGLIGSKDSGSISGNKSYGSLKVNCDSGFNGTSLHPHTSNSAIGVLGGNVSNNDTSNKSYVDCLYMGQQLVYSEPAADQIQKITQ